MRAAIYARVSTDEQAERGYSLEDQVERCMARARELGATIVRVFRDVCTGSVLERPGLSELRELVRLRGIDLLVCYDPDRLARNLSHQLLLTEEMDRLGVVLEFVNFEWKNTPEGRLFYSLRGAIAEYEKEKIRERSARGKIKKAREGKLTHDPKAFGYAFDPASDTYSVVEAEAAVVRDIFRWFVGEDLGYHAIARRLNEAGIPSPKGKSWAKATVKRIIHNTSYVGTLYLHRHNAEGVKNSRMLPAQYRVRRTERPREEWIPITVPAIVDKDLFERAQLKAQRIKSLYSGYSRAQYLLGGMLTCGLCGSTLHGNLICGKKRYYVCTARSPGKKGVPKCTLRFIPAEQLEAVVWDKVAYWLSDVSSLVRDLEDRSSPIRSSLERSIADVEAQLLAAADERSRLVELYQRGLIPLPEVEPRLQALSRRTEALNRRRQELLRQYSSAQIGADEASRLEELAREVVSKLPGLEFQDKKALIRSLVDRVTVYDDAVIIDVRLPGKETDALDDPGAVDVGNDHVRGGTVYQCYADGRHNHPVEGVAIR